MLANFNLNFNPLKNGVTFQSNIASRKCSNDYLEYSPDTDEFIKEEPKVSNSGQILKADGEVFNRHDTSLFRTDVRWYDLARYLDKRFDDAQKVNTYQYAASYGKEAYSMAIMLDKEFGKNGEKFLPIDAKDLSQNVIERNKKDLEKGKVQITGDDSTQCYAALKFMFCPDKFDEYIEENDGKFFIKGDYKDKIKFANANILDDLDNIDTENPSLFMCRNMWPYVDDSEYQDFANKLYEKLAPGSSVMIGDFDYKKIGYPKNFPEALIEAGFEPSNARINEGYELIFEKN